MPGPEGRGGWGEPPREIGAVPPARGPTDRNRAWPRGRGEGGGDAGAEGLAAGGRRRQIHNEGCGRRASPAGGTTQRGAKTGKERRLRSFRGGGAHRPREQRRGIPPPPAPRGLCPAAHAGGGEGAWWGGVAAGWRR
jgi:hypothetical protein